MEFDQEKNDLDQVFECFSIIYQRIDIEEIACDFDFELSISQCEEYFEVISLYSELLFNRLFFGVYKSESIGSLIDLF